MTFPLRLLALGLAAAAVSAAAGADAPPARLSADAAAAELSARSLDDPALREFLASHLGRPVPERWDFESLTWVAFYYQPSLQVARAQWESAQAAARTAAERPNPVVSLIPGYSTNSFGPSPWTPAISFDFLFETAGKRRKRAAAQRLAAEAARLDVMAAAWQARGELRRALIDTVAAENRAQAAGEVVRLQRALARRVEQREAAGADDALQVAAARTALITAESTEADARSRLPVARARLAAALGLPVSALAEATFDPATAIPPAVLSDAQEASARRQSWHQRSDLGAALARYEGARASYALEAARHTTDVHLAPGYQYDEGDHKWTLDISFEAPLFHPINQGPMAEARARVEEAAAQFLALQSQAMAAVDGAEAAAAAARLQLEAARRSEAEARRQDEMAKNRFQAGGADAIEVLGADLSLAVSRLALADAAAAAASAAGQVEDALQIPFSRISTVTSDPRRVAAAPGS